MIQTSKWGFSRVLSSNLMSIMSKYDKKDDFHDLHGAAGAIFGRLYLSQFFKFLGDLNVFGHLSGSACHKQEVKFKIEIQFHV